MIYNRYFGSKSLDEDSLNSPFENWPDRRYGMMEEICLSASFSSRNIALQAIEHFNFSTSLTERMTNLESRISSSHPKDIDGIKKAMKDSDKNSYLPAMLRRQDILSMIHPSNVEYHLLQLFFKIYQVLSWKIRGSGFRLNI